VSTSIIQVLSTCNPITIKAYAEAFANATVNIAGQGCNPIYFTAISQASAQASAIVCQGSNATVTASASAAASIFFNSTGVQACLVTAPLTPVTTLPNGGAPAPAPAPATKTFPALAGTNPSTAVAPTAPNLAGTTAVPPANQGIVAAKAPTTSASGRRSLA
jgi:hypothetical protein